MTGPLDPLPRTAEGDSGGRVRVRDLALVVGLFAAITIARPLVPATLDGVSLLYVLPITLIAVDHGRRGGLIAAGVALVLAAATSAVTDTEHAMVEYPISAAMFLSAALLVGAQTVRRRELERQRSALIEQLADLATRDPLTDLPNRRAWDARFQHELDRADRTGQPLSVVAIDVDDLKAVNTADGHPAGDALIVACADAWHRALRRTDFIARVGGDEFLSLLPECDAACATAVAERALALASTRCAASVGIATRVPGEPGDRLVARADGALYRAKRRPPGERLVIAEYG